MWRAVAMGCIWSLGTAGVATSAPHAAPVEVEVRSVRLDPDAGSPVVELVEKAARRRQLPIWIGPFEAQAIAVELEGIAPPRPLTHDLMGAVVEALEGRLDRVVITQLVGGTYHARLDLVRSGGRPVSLDARPSDALALALRLRRPIFVDDAVLATGGDAAAPARVFGITIQDLTPELAEVLALPGLRGALVTDVDPTSPARKLRRADVVIGVDGESVTSAGDLVDQLERRRAGQAMRIALRRQGQPLEVRLRVGPARGSR
jgi:bifunctional DNase/RNase